MKIYHYITGVVSILFLSSLFIWNSASAITSYDVTNEVQMYLDVTITATTATGIVLASPQRNGSNHTFATTTGGVLRLRSGSKVEDIHYILAEVKADNTVNLQGVTRNLCTGTPRAYVSCGNGQQFSRGTLVELSVDARILNLKANIDRANTYTAEQSYSGSGAFKMPTFTTEAERDRQTDEGDGNLACVTGTSQCYDYIGGAWRAHSGSNVTNATQTVAGKVEISTLTEMSTHSSTGSTTANLVVWNANLISSNATYYPASVTYGSGATTAFGTWGAVTDGEFNVFLDGVSTDVKGIVFTGVTTMTAVAERIEGELNTDATGTGYTISWTANGTSTGFTLVSSNVTGASSGSALTYVSGGAGTDLSGSGATAYMDGDIASPNVQTFNEALLNQSADAYKVPMLNADGHIDSRLMGSGSVTDATFLRGDNTWTSPISIYFGAGTDSDYHLTATGTLSPQTAHNYTSMIIDANAQLSSSVEPMPKPFVFNVTGDATINGKINLSGQGGSAGILGTVGGTGATLLHSLYIEGGQFETGNNDWCGGGGATLEERGGKSTNKVGTSPLSSSGADMLNTLDFLVANGSGGGGGNNNGGANGGGAFIMRVSGNLVFGANSEIDISGLTRGPSGENVGGGGGGGTAVIIVAGSFTDNGATVTASGGAGTVDTNCTSGEGGDGRLLIYSIKDGTITRY